MGPHSKECRYQTLNAHHSPLYGISTRGSNASNFSANWHWQLFWITCALYAGLLLKPYLEEVSGLELQSATPFEWSGASETSQASQYLPHIRRHIEEVVEEDKYCMFDARRYPKLLTVTGTTLDCLRWPYNIVAPSR